MLVWYALIPFLLVGMTRTATHSRTAAGTWFGIVLVWIFTVIYFAQYLTINLSYRQRDVMLPLVLMFAWIGIRWSVERSNWHRWYGIYWVLLAAMAVSHLVARAVWMR
jgi:hypothetical protein